MRQAAGRLWPFAAAAVALAYLLAMLVTGALPENRQIARFEAKGLLTQAPENVNRIEITLNGRSSAFLRQADRWAGKDGTPVQPARAATLDRALKIMHNSGPVRILAPEEIAGFKPTEYGFDGKSLSIALSGSGDVFLQAEFGNRNTDSVLQYMRLSGRGELYLMSGFVGKEWESAVAGNMK